VGLVAGPETVTPVERLCTAGACRCGGGGTRLGVLARDWFDMLARDWYDELDDAGRE
jgi:hypothetical protein